MSDASQDPIQVQANNYGALILALTLAAQTWALRRVETLRIKDDLTVNVRVSTDFDLTLTKSGRLYSELLKKGALPNLLLPLGFLAKKPLHDFSVTDQSGKPISFLTREETAPISVAALEFLAVDLVGENALTDFTRKFIADLVSADDVEGEKLIAEVQTLPSTREDLMAIRELWGHPEFRYIATNMARSFIAIAVLPGGPQDLSRRIVKYSYVTDLPWSWSSVRNSEESLLNTILIRLALRPARATIEIPLVSNSRSYHADLEAPGNLEIRLAQISRSRDSRETVLRQYEGKFPRVHMNVQGGSYGTVFKHELLMEISPQRRGFIRDSMFATIFATLALVAVYAFTQLSSHGSSASPIPLVTIVPGLLAAYLSRPTEHPLASRLYFGLRCVLALSALLAWMAAVVILVEVPEPVTNMIIALLMVVSVGCSALAVAAYKAATGPAGTKRMV
jgi:hypothetical protein